MTSIHMLQNMWQTYLYTTNLPVLHQTRKVSQLMENDKRGSCPQEK